MGRPVLVVGKPGVAANQLDVGAGVSHAGADLLAGAQGQERGEGVHEGNLPAQGQPNPDVDHRRLGHAQVEEARRMAIGEELGQRGGGNVRIKDDHVRVYIPVLGEGYSVGLALRYFSHYAPPSNSARA